MDNNISVANLFGLDTNLLERQRSAADIKTAFDTYGQDAINRNAMIGGAQLGRSMDALFGNKDPELERVTKIQGIVGELQNSGVDINDPEKLYPALAEQFQKAGLTREAMMAINEYRNVKEQSSKITNREEMVNVQREKIQAQADAAAAKLEASLAAKTNELAMRLQIAQLQGATQKEIAKMRIDGQREIAQMRADTAKEVAELKATLKQDAPLDDKAASRVAHNTEYDATINKGVELLDVIDKNPQAFSLTGRGKALISSVTNPKDPNVKALSDVQAFLKKARNAYLLEAKGTQTEGDAARAWEEFAGTLDFSSAEGAARSIKRINEELDNKRKANQEYLRVRNFGNKVKGTGTRDNPISLD